MPTTTSMYNSIHLQVQIMYNTRVLIWSVSNGYLPLLARGRLYSYSVMGHYLRSFRQDDSSKGLDFTYIYIPLKMLHKAVTSQQTTYLGNFKK